MTMSQKTLLMGSVFFFTAYEQLQVLSLDDPCLQSVSAFQLEDKLILILKFKRKFGYYRTDTAT